MITELERFLNYHYETHIKFNDGFDYSREDIKEWVEEQDSFNKDSCPKCITNAFGEWWSEKYPNGKLTIGEYKE